MKTAKKLKDAGGRGKAFLYDCDPPIEGYDPYMAQETSELPRHRYVIISAVNEDLRESVPEHMRYVLRPNPALLIFETYVFPSNEKGEWVDMGELPMSEKGMADPDGLLTKHGYTVIDMIEPDSESEPKDGDG